MKMNAWQWLGLILVLAGLALIIWRETRPDKPSVPGPGGPAPAVTQPAR